MAVPTQPCMGLAQVHQWHLANRRGGEGQHQVQRVSKGWCCMCGRLMQSKGAAGASPHQVVVKGRSMTLVSCMATMPVANRILHLGALSAAGTMLAASTSTTCRCVTADMQQSVQHASLRPSEGAAPASPAFQAQITTHKSAFCTLNLGFLQPKPPPQFVLAILLSWFPADLVIRSLLPNHCLVMFRSRAQ